MKILSITRSLSLIAVVVLLSGCGYTTKSALPPNFRTIYIQEFENSIDFTEENRRNLYLPLLEVDVRNAVVDRFLFDGNLRVADGDFADIILIAELTNYQRSALRFTDDDDVQEYRVHITVSMRLIEPEVDEPVWKEPSFTGEGTYFVTGPQASDEQTAIDEAIEDLARRIVERTIENW